MFCSVHSASLIGINAYLVSVEIDISDGLPAFDLVGLPDSSIRESKERVKAAIKNSEFSFPFKRVTVNLSPADQRKSGPHFDLPIATCILSAMEIINPKALDSTLIAGELSLDGTINCIRGVLPIACCAKQHDIKRLIIPKANASEAATIKGIDIIAVEHLKDLIDYLNGKKNLCPYKNNTINSTIFPEERFDFKDVKGQVIPKRAMEICASGQHNLLMIGPPGAGKTMMARCLPSILPPLTLEEAIEVTKIYSITGKLNSEGLIRLRPFRSPHHTITPSALIGGGRPPMPGEVSLANSGVLFLDELPEFSKSALEVLRQPLENKAVSISRVGASITYPAEFMLIVALNPCPCGFYPDLEKCSCSPLQIHRYLNKISGPLLDRIDLHVETQPINYEYLTTTVSSESSQVIRDRVLSAREIQAKRYKDTPILFNSQLSASNIHIYCSLGHKEQLLMKKAFERMQLSARGYHRILKVARTIADLDASDQITIKHLAEALQYRNLDRRYHLS